MAVRTKTASLPPPIKGWNAKDALADMDPLEAVILENWFPNTADVQLRKGFESYATGIGGAVETIMVYNGLTGSEMFACGNGGIYDVSSAGAVGAAAVGSLGGTKFQYVNFGTPGGQFLWCCNGVDAPRHYNGTTWATPSITGPTAANLAWVQSHQSRLWFGEVGKLSFWYLPVNSIAGTAAEFNLAPLARLGGYLVGMVSWTRDGGAGMDDLAVFVTSEGEAIVYQGIDPAAADTWSLIGVFRIGKPIGRNFSIKTGSDATLITEDGFVPLSKVLPIDRIGAEKIAISDRINDAVNTAVLEAGSLYGWQGFSYPRGKWILFNIPTANASGVVDGAMQFVFNAITGAACKFTGMDAVSWGLYGDAPYFGGLDGTVYKADTGTDDNGSNIEADMLQAFSYFGYHGQQKLFKMVRPVFATNGPFQAALGMNVDFDIIPPPTSPTFTTPGSAVWDVSAWDASSWVGDVSISKDWQSVAGLGFAGALRIVVASSSLSVSLRATDYIMEIGGAL